MRQLASRQTLQRLLLVGVFVVYATVLVRDGLVRAQGPHDNDWTLLMWLAKHARVGQLDSLAVGHYGFLQLVLVRLLLSVTGSTLVAAKLLNIAGTIAAARAGYAIVHTATASFAWGMTAAVAFLLWPSVYLTGQSEFGDPLALGLFATGVALLLGDNPRARSLVVAGVLMGVAGCVRLHFQTFAWAALIPALGYLLSIRHTGLLAAGILAGQLPMFVINWVVHRTLFSPIASGFIGQVVVGGANPYAMDSTAMLHPTGEVLREHKMKFLSVIANRLLDCPPLLLLLVALALAGFARTRDKRLGFLVLLALGYYAGFVTPAWGITPRLLEPFVFFVVISATVALFGLCRIPQVRTAAIAACLCLACLHLRLAKSHLRAERARINAAWDRNTAIEDVLHLEGQTDPRQVFATEWWIHPVRDPEFVPYYNFGFWNLFAPEFAKERPNPFPFTNNADAFFCFLRDHGVRYVVLQRDLPFEAIRSLCDATELPAGYKAIGQVADQCLFALKP